MTADIEALALRLARAKEDAALAESELDAALHAIVKMPRNEKQAVSKLVETALARVRVVRAELALAQTLAVEEKD